MKAAVLKKTGELQVIDIPKPICEKNEVIVDVKACGICGSDLRYFEGENPWALHTLGKNEENPDNMVLGHEFAGVVVEVGNRSLEHLLGKRVAVEPYNTCGMCEMCRTGRYNLCKDTVHIGHGAGWGKMDYYPGGMAEYCKVWATHVYEIPDSLSFEEAALLDPLAVAVHAVKVSNFSPCNDVFVMGSGAVGLCILQVVKAFGAKKVFSGDILQSRLSTASKLGADFVINADTEDILGLVADKTEGRGVDIVFDTVGTKTTQSCSLKMLSASGNLVNLVANSSTAEYKLLDLSAERSIKGSSNNLYDDFLMAINLMETGKVKAEHIITHKFSIDNVNEGFDLLFNAERNGALKVVILP